MPLLAASGLFPFPHTGKNAKQLLGLWPSNRVQPLAEMPGNAGNTGNTANPSLTGLQNE